MHHFNFYILHFDFEHKRMDCLFCKITQKELPADIVYEDEHFVAFKDIRPKAPVHLLVVPRKHIESIDHAEIHDKELLGALLLTAQTIARQQNLDGYKLQINVGRKGGQLIDHLHVHLVSGTITGEL